MDIFNLESLFSIVPWIIKTVISFLVLLISAKFLGQRAIAQLRLIDFIIAIILGNILASPLSKENEKLTGPIITTLTLVVLYNLSLKLTLKFRKLSRLLSPHPLTIIKNGEIIYKNMAKAKLLILYYLKLDFKR